MAARTHDDDFVYERERVEVWHLARVVWALVIGGGALATVSVFVADLRVAGLGLGMGAWLAGVMTQYRIAFVPVARKVLRRH